MPWSRPAVQPSEGRYAMKPTHLEQSTHFANRTSQQDGTEQSMENSLARKSPSGKRVHIDSAIDSESLNQLLTKNSSLEWKAGKGEWLLILVLAIVSLMVAIDATILVTALPTIAHELHGGATETFWTGTSYLLTQAVFQPFIVTLSDVFGRRLLYLISLGFFTLGTIGCCVSVNFTQLLAGRSVQGIGGGGILALGLVVLTDIIPLRQRPIFIGINQISWALGSISGPLLGGIFAQHTTWRWIFYINFPFCAIGFVTVPLVMRLHAERPPIKERLQAMDWFGSGLFIASTTSFLVGLTCGGSQYPWSSWRTLVPIIVGLVGFLTMIAWERNWASKPFLRLELFNSYSAIVAYSCTVLQGLLLFCKLYYIPFCLEIVKDFSPTRTGLAMMPITGALLPSSVIIGRLVASFGRFRWAIWSGWAIIITGTGLLILLDADLKPQGWILIFVVVGLGHGFVLMSLNVAIQAMAEIRYAADAAAMYIFTRTFGMCIGVAIGGTVFQNRLSKHLSDRNLPTAVAKNAEGFSERLKDLPRSSTEYQEFISAYSEGFRNVFQVLTAVAVLAALLSLFIKRYSMDKGLGSEHILLRVIKKQESDETDVISDIDEQRSDNQSISGGIEGTFVHDDSPPDNSTIFATAIV